MKKMLMAIVVILIFCFLSPYVFANEKTSVSSAVKMPKEFFIKTAEELTVGDIAYVHTYKITIIIKIDGQFNCYLKKREECFNERKHQEYLANNKKNNDRNVKYLRLERRQDCLYVYLNKEYLYEGTLLPNEYLDRLSQEEKNEQFLPVKLIYDNSIWEKIPKKFIYRRIAVMEINEKIYIDTADIYLDKEGNCYIFKEDRIITKPEKSERIYYELERKQDGYFLIISSDSKKPIFCRGVYERMGNKEDFIPVKIIYQGETLRKMPRELYYKIVSEMTLGEKAFVLLALDDDLRCYLDPEMAIETIKNNESYPYYIQRKADGFYLFLNKNKTENLSRFWGYVIFGKIWNQQRKSIPIKGIIIFE